MYSYGLHKHLWFPVSYETQVLYISSDVLREKMCSYVDEHDESRASFTLVTTERHVWPPWVDLWIMDTFPGTQLEKLHASVKNGGRGLTLVDETLSIKSYGWPHLKVRAPLRAIFVSTTDLVCLCE